VNFRQIVSIGVFCFIFSIAIMASAAFQQGDDGQDVKEIQAKLQTLGYNISVDGSYGPATAAAVKKFQAEHSLTADGAIGEQTYQMLMGRDIPVSRGDSSTTNARRLMSVALRYTGTPYVFGGTAPGGFDCSGYVRYVYAQMGVYLPRCADEQFLVGRSVSYSALQPGDLVFFETYASGASHVGIYLGNDKFVAASSSRGVHVDSLRSSYYSSRYLGARRVN
jgi:cell wall-associated NlpC family hydrolase